jgi:hypothetical protein
MTSTHLTDDEIDDICRPLKQHAAQVRYLRTLGLSVERRPDGSPLVRRCDWERRTAAQAPAAPAAGGPRWKVAA